MPSLVVKQNKNVNEDSSIDELASLLRQEEKHNLSYTPWSSFPYKADVAFTLITGTNCFCLQFRVDEKNIKAQYTKANDPVYEDSCVEFFISLDEGNTYYNFEFNCIGTVLCGFGNNRHNRERLPEALLNKIKCQAIIQRQKEKEHWELTVIIPFSLLQHYDLSALDGKKGKANFYKCGDELPEPHYISWSNIKSNKPDFHLPESFGELLFE